MVANALVIGIGNPHRGDDIVGLTVARRLMARCGSDVRVVEHDGESTGLVDCLSSAERAFVVDACMAGGQPGRINRFDVSTTAAPTIAFACSTHGMGLAEAVELARALGRLPRHCVIYAIDSRRFDIGAALSPEVAAAAEEVAELIEDELRRQSANCSP